MRFKSRAALAAIVLLVVFNIGCGDTFRPIAIPIISQGGQPQGLREVVVLSTGGSLANSPEGDTTHIDVSGDANVGQVVVGRDPVHVAVLENGAETVVVNRAEESLSIYSTLTPTAAQPPTFVSLPIGSVPVFAYTNVTGVVYVAESGTNNVAVVSTSGNPTALTSEVAVGATPVGLIGTPDGTHLFVANQGDNTVSVIDTGTNTLVSTLPNTIAVGSSPSYLAVNAAGTRVFVVNSASNNVSVIDTTTDTVIATPAVGTSPNFAYFDAANNRLWVTNGGSNSVSVINVDPNSTPPFTVTNISLTPSCGAANPKFITVLADGSRAYVADSGCSAVSVLNALSNTVTKTITVGTAPVSIVSSPDSSKVYTANSGSGNISIIRTSDDTVINTLAAPAGTSPIYAAISPF
jgi:YVTN family beta-propeller protein